jgi:hypothetical protein
MPPCLLVAVTYFGGWRRFPALAMFSWGTSSIKMRTASGGLLASLQITSVTPLLIFSFCSLLRVPATLIFTYGIITPLEMIWVLARKLILFWLLDKMYSLLRREKRKLNLSGYKGVLLVKFFLHVVALL